MIRAPQPRLPLDPLLRLVKAQMDLPDHDPEHCGCGANRKHVGVRRSCASTAAMIREMDIEDAVFYRWVREGGLTPRAADHIATKLGLHPLLIWPQWGAETAA